MRPDGVLQIQVASRLTKRQDLLAPFGVRSPLWSGTTLLVNPTVPRTEEVQGSPEASEFVSILGATWLLMEQRTVAETRVLSDPTSTSRGGAAAGKAAKVSIIELRRPEPQFASQAAARPDAHTAIAGPSKVIGASSLAVRTGPSASRHTSPIMRKGPKRRPSKTTG
jgi:hypothetical protein